MQSVEGLMIRAVTVADADDLGLIIVSATFSAFLGAVPEQALDLAWSPATSAERWRRSLSEPDKSGEVFVGAELAGRLVGYAVGGTDAVTEGFNGKLEQLYVLPSLHRRGIGRALVREAARRLAAGGSTNLEVGCARENPSNGFYEHLGGELLGTIGAKIDAYETIEVLYGWRSIATLT